VRITIETERLLSASSTYEVVVTAHVIELNIPCLDSIKFAHEPSCKPYIIKYNSLEGIITSAHIDYNTNSLLLRIVMRVINGDTLYILEHSESCNPILPHYVKKIRKHLVTYSFLLAQTMLICVVGHARPTTEVVGIKRGGPNIYHSTRHRIGHNGCLRTTDDSVSMTCPANFGHHLSLRSTWPFLATANSFIMNHFPRYYDANSSSIRLLLHYTFFNGYTNTPSIGVNRNYQSASMSFRYNGTAQTLHTAELAVVTKSIAPTRATLATCRACIRSES